MDPATSASASSPSALPRSRKAMSSVFAVAIVTVIFIRSREPLDRPATGMAPAVTSHPTKPATRPPPKPSVKHELSPNEKMRNCVHYNGNLLCPLPENLELAQPPPHQVRTSPPPPASSTTKDDGDGDDDGESTDRLPIPMPMFVASPIRVSRGVGLRSPLASLHLWDKWRDYD